MARSSAKKGSAKGAVRFEAASAADIARRPHRSAESIAGNAPSVTSVETAVPSGLVPAHPNDAGSGVSARRPRKIGTISLAQTDRILAAQHMGMRRKIVIWIVLLVVLSFLSAGIIGGGYTAIRYVVYSPVEVGYTAWVYINNFIADTTHLLSPIYPAEGDAYTDIMLRAVAEKAGVVLITLVCAVLLSVSGALYQNVFKNPIAGPGMLGVSSGVQLGMMVLVYCWGAEAIAMTSTRYTLCYLFGAAILVFVILAGRKLSGKNKPFDIVTMLLIGSILSQLVGFVVSYYTMFVMDPSDYAIYITLSEMLVVDVSPVSWGVLAIACAVSLIPIWLLRFRLNALAFDEQEVRFMGVNVALLRAVALICGAIMILAAQIHIGAVALVSLIVPFLARSWFGCEFRHQLIGNLCISTILLLVCRDVVDLVPFVGDGIGIGSAVSLMALPLFLLIMAKHLRGWE